MEIDAFLKERIDKANKDGNFKLVTSLSYLANRLDVARQLSGDPPANFNFKSSPLKAPQERKTEQTVARFNKMLHEDPHGVRRPSVGEMLNRLNCLQREAS